MAVESEAALPAGVAATPRNRRVTGPLLKLAWPVLIERLSLTVLSAIDAVLVGHYVGTDGLAAVGIGALLFWIPLAGAIAFDVGSTAVVARDVGAGDQSRVRLGLHAAIDYVEAIGPDEFRRRRSGRRLAAAGDEAARA